MLGLGTIDIIFLIILVISIIRVTVKGFIDEFFSKAAVIVGAIVAVLFYKLLSPAIASLLNDSFLSPVVSFLILFLATYLVIKLLQVLIGSLFENESLRNLDKALGSFLGLIEGILIIIIILMILNLQPFFDTNELLGNSIFAEILSPFVFEVNFS